MYHMVKCIPTTTRKENNEDIVVDAKLTEFVPLDREPVEIIISWSIQDLNTTYTRNTLVQDNGIEMDVVNSKFLNECNK